jgi:hypothetical protein
MVRRILSCAAGLLALAAFSLPAVAEPSVISFVSGPLAGVAAEDVYHDENSNLGRSGIRVTEYATFRDSNTLAWVQWSRLSGNNIWRDTGLDDWTQEVREIFKATGATVVSGDRAEVGGFNAQYRNVDLTGTPNRCGVFALGRGKHSIIGFACRRDGQPVPVLAVLRGLAIQGVIQP